jgi:LCP family protein required for cell wall assembly
VRLVSLERGIGVPILEGKYAGEYDLLTHIFRWGGADLLIKTVEHCFKIDVKHYVRLNFAAVEKIVDTIGGIDLEISEDEAFGLNEWAGDRNRIVHSGVNRVNGETALRFARLRWIDSDWQRVGRQRKVILSVVNELKDSSLKELDDLADEVLPLIQTNLTKLEIAELILYAPNFLRSEFDQMTIPKQGTYGGMAIRKGAGAFAVDYEINNDLLYRFLYEGATSEELLAE